MNLTTRHFSPRLTKILVSSCSVVEKTFSMELLNRPRRCNQKRCECVYFIWGMDVFGVVGKILNKWGWHSSSTVPGNERDWIMGTFFHARDQPLVVSKVPWILCLSVSDTISDWHGYLCDRFILSWKMSSGRCKDVKMIGCLSKIEHSWWEWKDSSVNSINK